MLYKTICLQMIQDRPELYDQLLSNRKLLPTLDLYCNELKTSHLTWKEQLSQVKPKCGESQIASEALEIALQDMKDRLSRGTLPVDNETLSLDAAMDFTRGHTQAG